LSSIIFGDNLNQHSLENVMKSSLKTSINTGKRREVILQDKSARLNQAHIENLNQNRKGKDKTVRLNQAIGLKLKTKSPMIYTKRLI